MLNQNRYKFLHFNFVTKINKVLNGHGLCTTWLKVTCIKLHYCTVLIFQPLVTDDCQVWCSQLQFGNYVDLDYQVLNQHFVTKPSSFNKSNLSVI